MRSTAAPYTESRLARLVRNKRVGFPVVEQSYSSLLQSIVAFTQLRRGLVLINKSGVLEAENVRMPIDIFESCNWPLSAWGNIFLEKATRALAFF